MERGRMQMFIKEVQRQVQFGLIAAADLNRATADNDMDRAWYSIQSLLVATANVSKLLWPSKETYASRGDTLRTALQVQNDSPLESRSFRNHFEHFDERLEKWGISPQTHMIVDSNIGSLSSIRVGSSGAHVRQYDPSTQTLTLREEVYELRPVVESLATLQSMTQQALREVQLRSRPRRAEH